jgi:hypothetical protein
MAKYYVDDYAHVTLQMRKKIDPRVRSLVEDCSALRQRSMFVVVGDRGRDQVGGCTEEIVWLGEI